ncbi:MAG: glycosyltransferase family 39 protein [Flavobacteriaceae bacterium]|nr:glycosyltransferase family 39 protein [Flavobacteriaceae bacterium]
MIKLLRQRFNSIHFAAAFWILVAIRMYFNGVLPLMDKTEARYGEIARLMSETGNWITPQIDYGLPFWAKPPLSTWASALSISLFGSSEFFVRFPYLIVMVLLAIFIGKYRKEMIQSVYFPGIILLTIPEFYLHAGVVSTDTFLCFSIALTMFGFWEAMQKKANTYWKYLFFTGIGIGLLAKGPIIGILTLPPILLWALITNSIKKMWFQFPWIGGISLLLAISLPWYLLAELRTAGFIDYFVVGEHFERYFNSEWKGDKYGFPKQQPLGMAWIFLIVFLLPWTLAFIQLLVRKWNSIRQESWLLFLIFWALWTPLFFTSSKSLIHPYILPSCIPVALFISYYWSSIKNKKIYIGTAIGLPMALFFVHLSGMAKPLYSHTTDKYLIHSLDQTSTIFVLDQKSYSSQFYTQGKVKVIEIDQLKSAVNSQKTFYILLSNKQFEQLDDTIVSKLYQLDSNKKRGVYQFKP